MLLRKSLTKFILVITLTLFCTTFSAYTSFGQVTSLPPLFSNSRELIDTLTMSRQIGNILYGPVTLDGRPLLYVAVPASSTGEDKSEEKDSLLDQRIKRIENNLRDIIKRGFDPNTLQINASVLNGETVILASDKKQIKQQIVGTITQADIQLYGESADQIGTDSSKILKNALIRAYQERQPEYFQQQLLKGGLAIGILVFVSFLISLLRKIIKNRLKQIKEYLRSNTLEEITQNNTNTFVRWINFIINYLTFLPYFHKIRFGKLQHIPDNLYSFITKPASFFDPEEYRVILDKQFKSALLFVRLLLILLILIWLHGISWILSLFPETRWISLKLAGTPVSLLLIWSGVIVATKIIGLIIDWSLNTWTEGMSLSNNFSPRKISRITTLASALRGISTLLLVAIGIILSLQAFNLPVGPVLAGAGILGFAISFGSQSIIKDMFSGAINLMNDSYAIGDTVTIGSNTGLVEDVNLFVTRIRAPNGDLVTIPNGSVGIVRNQTKDWSRVDYQIQVSHETDVEKALIILEETAHSIYNDPQWQSSLLEPPQTIGIENLSSEGISLRIWMKTKPGLQWTVARELRLRVIESFNRSQIDIASPHQTISLQNIPTNKNDNFP